MLVTMTQVGYSGCEMFAAGAEMSFAGVSN